MKILFKAIVGSQAYGTSTPESDVDVKGVYIDDLDDLLGSSQSDQLNITDDETYYEIKNFLNLCSNGKVNALELLYIPDEFILEKHPIWDMIVEQKEMFLTKKCKNSFIGFAIDQIKRASGLEKKMNWEKSRTERKTIHDFCYVVQDGGKSIPLQEYLDLHDITQDICGLAKINHMPNNYSLVWSFHDKFRGIGNENSNDVNLSSIPKQYADYPTLVMSFNKDAYSIHCKEYREYCEWLEKRNKARYVDYNAHGQQYDGKNLLHTTRLLDVAAEIPVLKTIQIRRPNAEYLLKIRRGEVDLKIIIENAENKIKEIDTLYDNCDLPDKVDMQKVEELLIKIRKQFYNLNHV